MNFILIKYMFICYFIYYFTKEAWTYLGSIGLIPVVLDSVAKVKWSCFPIISPRYLCVKDPSCWSHKRWLAQLVRWLSLMWVIRFHSRLHIWKEQLNTYCCVDSSSHAMHNDRYIKSGGMYYHIMGSKNHQQREPARFWHLSGSLSLIRVGKDCWLGWPI